MKMNEIEITSDKVTELIIFSQENDYAEGGVALVSITFDQAEIVANEILRLAKEKE